MRMRFKPYARPELLACDFHVHEPLTHGGHWHELYARPDQPWHLELGCGTGGFLAQVALTHPRQLLQYRQLMDEGAEIWFKTDDDDLFRDSLSYFPAAGFEITWQTFDLHKNEPDWNLRTEHEGMFSEQGIPIKALIARKGPDSTVTWVEPKALAKQQEAEDDAD